MTVTAGARRDGPRADINVTPLVDVVLVLLIIFMVVTPLLQVSLPADMPRQEAEAAVEPPEQDQVVVSIREDGTLWLNRERVTEPDLAERLKAIMSKRAEKVAFLAGADNLELGRVVHVMDLCRGAGVSRIGLIEVGTFLFSEGGDGAPEPTPGSTP
jgi:biopolymer transport protein TolR